MRSLITGAQPAAEGFVDDVPEVLAERREEQEVVSFQRLGHARVLDCSLIVHADAGRQASNNPLAVLPVSVRLERTEDVQFHIA